jgi:hypothetical protein
MMPSVCVRETARRPPRRKPRAELRREFSRHCKSPRARFTFALPPTASSRTATLSRGPCGVVFELTPTGGELWTERVIHTFTGGSDNGEPSSALVVDDSGNLYGTTDYTGCDGCTGFYSTVFKMSTNGIGAWTHSVIYSFTDGSVPAAGLTLDAAGNLYGTTAFVLYDNSNGTVFELTPSGGSWTRGALYSFTGGTDGRFPSAGVVFDAAGNLYGTTFEGGTKSCLSGYNGCGVAYKLAPASGGQWIYTSLYAFIDNPDGAQSDGGVVLEPAGNLYGTTEIGGTPIKEWFSRCHPRTSLR